VKTHFESRWANHAARAVLTLAAVGLFFAMRPDIYGYMGTHVRADYQRKIVTPKIIDEYMRANKAPKLQIGAGSNNPAGWLNTDIEPTAQQAYVDASQHLPFADGSFYYVFGEHVIEHLTYDDGLAFFKEAHRILAPGGKIRMVTPNLMQYISLFNEPDPEHSPRTSHFVARKLEAQDWTKTVDPAGMILNNQMRWFGHQFLYSPRMLRASMEQAGFTNIREYVAGESEDPVLKAADFGPGTEYKDVNAFEAMALEATR